MALNRRNVSFNTPLTARVASISYVMVFFNFSMVSLSISPGVALQETSLLFYAATSALGGSSNASVVADGADVVSAIVDVSTISYIERGRSHSITQELFVTK